MGCLLGDLNIQKRYTNAVLRFVQGGCNSEYVAHLYFLVFWVLPIAVGSPPPEPRVWTCVFCNPFFFRLYMCFLYIYSFRSLFLFLFLFTVFYIYIYSSLFFCFLVFIFSTLFYRYIYILFVLFLFFIGLFALFFIYILFVFYL